MKLEHTPPRILLGLWPVIDAILCRVRPIHAVTADPDALLRVERRTHVGGPAMLANGLCVQTGQTLLEIHLATSWFRRRRAESRRAEDITRDVLVRLASDLRHLALQLRAGAYPDVVAMHGVTFLDAGARRLGFEVRDLPSGRRYTLTTFYMSGLMAMSRLTRSSERGSRRRPLRELWMSRERLLQTYGTRAGAQRLDALSASLPAGSMAAQQVWDGN